MRSISPFLTPFPETAHTKSKTQPKPSMTDKRANKYLHHLPCTRQALATKAGVTLKAGHDAMSKLVSDGLAEPWGHECSEMGKLQQVYIPTNKVQP